MTERFLHYLWKMKLLATRDLQTCQGEPVQIISPGEPNPDAGPDFQHARIRIGKTLWAGNVELHVKSSEWYQHLHQNDPAYDTVILHVVFDEDQTIIRNDGSPLPSLAVKGQFNETLLEQYGRLMQSAGWIPCEQQVSSVPAVVRKQWLHRLTIERLEEKINPILEILEKNHHNWEETFYGMLASSFGARINSEPFLQLASHLPLKVLAHHKNSLPQLEALLFGTAGFLEEPFKDAYPNELKKEFRFLKKKYGLVHMKKHTWKFLRLRPANFPTVRIAQLAALIYQSTHLLSKLLAVSDVKQAGKLFDVSASAYWITHYRFDKPAGKKEKKLGDSAIDVLLINTVVPVLFAHARMHGNEDLQHRVMQFAAHLPPEVNSIIRRWKQSGITAESAFESQALLQLKNQYCRNFRCLECAIGHKIISGLAPLKSLVK